MLFGRLPPFIAEAFDEDVIFVGGGSHEFGKQYLFEFPTIVVMP
jgi:hypothetical protein